MRQLPYFPFQAAAFGDVANVALNDLAMIDLIDVADKLNFDLLPGLGFEWHIVVADIPLVLQFSESGFVFLSISKHTDLPKFLAYYLNVRIAQHVLDEGIGIEDLTLSFVEDEDGILSSFKESPIAEFRILQCYFRAPALGDVFDGEQDQAGGALSRLEATGIQQEDFSADGREGVLNFEVMDGVLIAKYLIEQPSQLRNVPLTVAQVVNNLVLCFLR